MGLSQADLCVVLVEPSHPGNIGAVARAMNNMGVSRLKLVNPCPHDTPEAMQRATHSDWILRDAEIHPSLSAALQDRHLAIGTTARPRARHAVIDSVGDIHRLLPGAGARIALVFGRESSGLSNMEMSACNAWIHIPTHGDSASLNLAQAVLLTLYELSRHYESAGTAEASPATELADATEVEGVKHHLETLLAEIRFFRSPQQQATLRHSFADLIGRARLTRLDARLLRGIFHRIQVRLKRRSEGRK